MADPGLLELTVGAPAHGGFCVARVDDQPTGQVVFVRHALPGERVRARVTDDSAGSYLRADAIEILRPAPERVTPPCPHAGAGRCGGCDWQHASGAAQRAIKATVVREALSRWSGLDLDVTVEPLGPDLLGWRTRVVYATARDGRLGLHRHRSHAVETLEACPLGAPGVGDAAALGRTWPDIDGVELAVGEDGPPASLTHRAVRPAHRSLQRGRRAHRRPPDRVTLVDGPPTLIYGAAGRRFEVAAGGFWQVHPAAADAFAHCVLAQLAPRPGERVLDLYSGAGLFTAVLGAAVGPGGRVIGLEADAQAVADADRNTADLPHVEVRRATVDASAVLAEVSGVDLVVLDPPRSGAGREVMAAVLSGGARAVSYVACDPVALARDLAAAHEAGWRLVALRAFDAFPMTQHVECVALLEPDR